MFKNAGFGADAVADLSTALTAFTADFASFNNLSIDEAFQKIQSGLAGETEAVRRYGIDVSAAAVQTEAYAMGIAEVGDKLTEAQKIQARTSIILKDGADAMGDVARTAESYANTQRDLAENTEELAAAFGQALAPAAADATSGLASIAGGLADYTNATEDAKRNALEFAGISEDTSNVFQLYDEVVWKVYNSLGWYKEGTDAATKSTEDAAKGIYDTAEAALRASLGNEALADSADMVADAAEAEQDAIDDLASAIEGLGSKFSDADAAQDDLTASIRDAREPFRELRDAQKQLAAATTDSEKADARKAVSAAKATLTVKGNSKAALENRDALRDLADKTLQSASAFTTLDGDTKRAAAETRRGRVAFIEMATQLGMTKAEANRYADQLGLIPKNVRSNVALEGVEAAQADARAVQSELAKIPRVLRVSIVSNRVGPLADGLRASGGPVSADKTYMVGEQGPELLKLQGSNGIITPNSRTPAQQAPAGNTYNVYGYPDDATLRAIERREQLVALRKRMAA